ncbi:Cystinosin-like isoform E [Glycine soja]|uniref:Cystinosin homolog n=1 Tax=Glycine soja TaxID=3848 RepID=A0A445FCP8_GLYSO|nr:Cystinosin-like isoform E [Glycine soja]
MVPWNSFPLEVIYQVLGWLAFLSWSVAGYPQLILNFRRKSVVGLSLDYEILNLTKHFSYLIYNASLFFVPAVQKQYFEKYGHGQMIPVAANDVAFSTHSVIVHLIILSQIAMFERGSQKFSKYAIAIVVVVWFSAAICFFIALPSQSWLWLISIFNIIQVVMTLIKYFPQAFMNFLRKSTDGFSIGTILLDFSGGIFNYSQMVVQSIDQGSWVNFYGNIGKVLISLWSYLIYNASLFFSPAIQKQYFEKYGYGQMIPVAANDVAFSIHSVILNLIILSQISMFERGNQKFSNYAIAIVVVVWFSVAVCFFIALHSQSWLWLISIFNTIQAVMILIKYFPQVRMLYPPPYYVLHVACLAFMNFLRKSTDGFSIGSVLLDFSGGVFNYSQMLVQSKDQGL